MRQVSSICSGWSAVALVALAMAGCTTMPELNEVKLVPEVRSFLPSNSQTYSGAIAMRNLRPVGPQDLVDGQGQCAAPSAAPAAEPGTGGADAGIPQAALARPVALEMTECEVAQALGVPTRAEFGSNERGDRAATLVYTASDRSGIYRFSAGRLVSIERSPDAVPPKPEKPSRKASPAKKPARPNA